MLGQSAASLGGVGKPPCFAPIKTQLQNLLAPLKDPWTLALLPLDVPADKTFGYTASAECIRMR
jgi:hypothetical protein